MASRLGEMIQAIAQEEKLEEIKRKRKTAKRDPVLQRHHKRLDAAIAQQVAGRQSRKMYKVGRPRTIKDDSGMSKETTSPTIAERFFFILKYNLINLIINNFSLLQDLITEVKVISKCFQVLNFFVQT